MEIDNWKERIKPFEWVQYKEKFSVRLKTGDYLQDVFDARSDEGFKGNGYDWESLAKVFLKERCWDLYLLYLSDKPDRLKFGSKANMFCVYSKDDKSLQDFICLFKEACEDEKLIKDLFSRAEKDNTIYYLIANSVAYLCIFAVCVFIVINLIESVIVRVCVLPVLFLLCGYLEQWVVSGFVNVLLDKIFGKYL